MPPFSYSSSGVSLTWRRVEELSPFLVKVCSQPSRRRGQQLSGGRDHRLVIYM